LSRQTLPRGGEGKERMGSGRRGSCEGVSGLGLGDQPFWRKDLMGRARKVVVREKSDWGERSAREDFKRIKSAKEKTS